MDGFSNSAKDCRKRVHSPCTSASFSDIELPAKKGLISRSVSKYKFTGAELAQMKVLLVGVGGVGSEILKNLLMVGFRHIDLIDLDTIELSNLNRQFLFRNSHVGKAKAEVAKMAAKGMVDGKPFAESFSMNVFVDDVTKLDYKFFIRYRLIWNALDASEPRMHVNRMCVMANVCLVESGTSGHLGQTSAIVPGLTECYACTEKPKKQVSYPTCTIRSTPSKIIHCVVWGKAVFNQLFRSDASFEDDVGPEEQNLEDGRIVPICTHDFAVRCEYDGEKIFEKLFIDDIKVLLSMDNMWKKRTPPSIWSPEHDEKLKTLFIEKFHALSRIYSKMGSLVFDKDDDTMIEFVCAATNIRATLFGIPPGSLFDIKHMAGAIIPAVASTNAIVAGLAVLQGLSILNNDESSRDNLKQVFVSYKLSERSCQTIRYTRKPERKMILGHSLISPFEAPGPNNNCIVCNSKRLRIRLNMETVTIGDLRHIFEKHLLLANVEATTTDGMMFLSPDRSKENDYRSLKSIELVDGCTLLIEGNPMIQGVIDEEQDLQSYEVIIDHDHKLEKAEFDHLP